MDKKAKANNLLYMAIAILVVVAMTLWVYHMIINIPINSIEEKMDVKIITNNSTTLSIQIIHVEKTHQCPINDTYLEIFYNNYTVDGSNPVSIGFSIPHSAPLRDESAHFFCTRITVSRYPHQTRIAHTLGSDSV